MDTVNMHWGDNTVEDRLGGEVPVVDKAVEVDSKALHSLVRGAVVVVVTAGAARTRAA